MQAVKELETSQDILAAAQRRGFSDLEDAAAMCVSLTAVYPSPRNMRSYESSHGCLSRWQLAVWRIFFLHFDLLTEEPAVD